MKYIILEIQTNFEGTVGIPPVASYSDRQDAEAKYHTVLAAAAKSGLMAHGAVMLDNTGRVIDSKCYHKEIADTEQSASE